VSISHIAVLAGALLALLTLPYAIASQMRSVRLYRALRRSWVRRPSADLAALRRLDRGIRTGPRVQRSMPCLDQIAADLRRLDRQRQTGATLGSERWRAAVVRAYDLRLELACGSLGLPHHLGGLRGLDLDLERVRVEGRLQAEGVELR
jgi:hypothetical protein